MKKQIIIKISAALVVSAFLLFNVGTLRCAPPTDHFREAKSQVRKALPTMDNNRDQDLEEEKHQKFQMVEWLIIQSLMNQYQKLERVEDLEDDLN
jgi:hypothetical protein